MVPTEQKLAPLVVRRSYFDPIASKWRVLVESPGTAPGSDPIITGAFIAIVEVAHDKFNIDPQRS